MTTQEVLAHFGSHSSVADALGIRRQSIYLWGEEPPKGRQFQIQVLTKGKLKASATVKSKSH